MDELIGQIFGGRDIQYLGEYLSVRGIHIQIAHELNAAYIWTIIFHLRISIEPNARIV